MTAVRIKGFKIFYDRTGRQRCYHRATGAAIDLVKFPIGTAEFLAECAKVYDLHAPKKARAGTLGALVAAYRVSPSFLDLAPRTRADYLGKLDYLKPLDDMALSAITAPFIVRARDKAAAKHGRRFGNYVKAVLSIVLAWGAERGWVEGNAAEKIKNIRRKKDAPHANRPWSDAERFAMLDAAPIHLKVPLALGMYTGLREGDVLKLPKTAVKEGVLAIVTAKAKVLVTMPIPAALERVLAEAPRHAGPTIAVNSMAKQWTESGFRASWRKLRLALEKEGAVQPGLTFHGLRHSVATSLRESGVDPRTIADALGQKTEGMALHYSKSADLSKKMGDVVRAMDASERAARAKFDKRSGKEVSNSTENAMIRTETAE